MRLILSLSMAEWHNSATMAPSDDPDATTNGMTYHSQNFGSSA
jgi:hypothetical protein